MSSAFGYDFKNKTLLTLALTHKSYGNEFQPQIAHSNRDNERLEFLGDAVLDLVISELLIHTFPHALEGELSKLRAALVNEKTLATLGHKLNLGPLVLLGKGEEHTGGRSKDSIIASTFEALVAAIYIDGGMTVAREWLRSLFSQYLQKSTQFFQDHKTKLQESMQALYQVAPSYEVAEARGPDHDKTFQINLMMKGRLLASAQGKSKKEAEQRAAQMVLERFDELTAEFTQHS